MAIWAADIGGTTIKMAVVARERILRRDDIPAMAQEGLRPALGRMLATWRAMSMDCGLIDGDCSAVGFGFPGIVDPRTGRIWAAPKGKFDDALDVDLSGWFTRSMNRPVFVCNDANAALVGEWQYGAAKGCRNICMMTLGTGVGTAVIIEGRPFRGTHGLGGNAGGHLTIQRRGEHCLCGNVGCIEQQASSWAIRRQAAASPLWATSLLSKEKVVDYAAVFRLADAGDPLAAELMASSLDAWGAGAVNMIHAYDPEKLILGGGVMRSADRIIPQVEAYVRRHAWAKWGVPIVPAALGSDAGLMGIAYLASAHLSMGMEDKSGAE